MGEHAGKVPDAVSVGVSEGLRVDLVQDRVSQPAGRRGGGRHGAILPRGAAECSGRQAGRLLDQPQDAAVVVTFRVEPYRVRLLNAAQPLVYGWWRE